MRIKKIFWLFAVWCLAVAAEPVQVISLAPAVTEIILAVGGKADLAGRSTACDIPEVKHVPMVGDMGKPFVEPVLKSRAKVILTDTLAPVPQWGVLKRCGIEVIQLPGRSVSDLPGNIRMIGRVLHREAAAEQAACRVEKELAALRSSLPEHPVRALVVIALPPVVTCGESSFLSNALSLAGVENISGGIKQDYFVLNSEHIIAAAPEVIISFMPAGATEKYFSRNEFRNIPAVKERKFFYPDVNRLCRMAPALPGALQELRSLLR